MKKTSAAKKQVSKSRANTRVSASKAVSKQGKLKPCFNPGVVSIYVYWFIILFFVAATFYILGRSHNSQPSINEIKITEEVLLQAGDYFDSGKEKLMAGNIDEAISDLTTAIEAGVASVDTFILRGEAYMQSGNYRDALSDFNTVLTKDPINPVAYYDRYLLDIRLEDYNAAMNDINNALAANVSNPSTILQMRDLYAKRGQLNLWMKNWEGAVADYTNSLALPEGEVSPTVYAERAEAYTALGKFADAVSDYSSAVRVISEQIQGAASMAERESMSSNAMGYFEKSAALNLKLGNIEAARTDLESAYTIAVALNNEETTERLQGLLADLEKQTSAESPTENVAESK